MTNPNETKHITIEYNPANAGNEKLKVEVECWNNVPHPTPVKPGPMPDPKKPAPANK